MVKVSVIMITYGQEKYISEAINGVINQKCNFFKINHVYNPVINKI